MRARLYRGRAVWPATLPACFAALRHNAEGLQAPTAGAANRRYRGARRFNCTSRLVCALAQEASTRLNAVQNGQV